MQLRYLGSCRCYSWAAHTHWCITSATLPALCKVRKCRRGSEVHHHDFAVCDNNHWNLWYCLHNWKKTGKGPFPAIKTKHAHTDGQFSPHSGYIQTVYGDRSLSYTVLSTTGKTVVGTGQNQVRDKPEGCVIAAGHSQATNLIRLPGWTWTYPRVVSWLLDKK